MALSVVEDRQRVRPERMWIVDDNELSAKATATEVIAGPGSRYPTERAVKLRIASEAGGESRLEKVDPLRLDEREEVRDARACAVLDEGDAQIFVKGAGEEALADTQFCGRRCPTHRRRGKKET